MDAARFRIVLAAFLAVSKKFLLIPILSAIIGLVFVSRFTNWFSGPDAYRVYFVGKMSEPTVRLIHEGLKEELKKFDKLNIGGVPVELAPAEDDQGEPEQAQATSKDIARRNDTLLVVGHGYSSTTKLALPNYLDRGDPVPVILTTETNPNLLPPSLPEANRNLAFRLSPTDAVQAKTAADYALSTLSATSFWVVQDSENEVYSKYLAREFTRIIQESHKAVVLFSSNTSILPPEAIKACKIDCVFFAGEWFNALILVRQIRNVCQHYNIDCPKIILSDWSADRRLYEQGGADVDGVYLTFARSAEEVNNHGYEYYGRDAATIIADLVQLADERLDTHRSFLLYLWRLLNIHRVGVARSLVSDVMRNAVTDRDLFPNPKKGKLMPSKESYCFRNMGLRDLASFHIWQVECDHADCFFSDLTP